MYIVGVYVCDVVYILLQVLRSCASNQLTTPTLNQAWKYSVTIKVCDTSSDCGS